MSEIARVKIGHKTVTVNGSKWRAKAPWAGLSFSRAEPRVQSSLMMMVCGSRSAPKDVHLTVPWCHPEDQTGQDSDWDDCQYRVRPAMEVGKKWNGRAVEDVAFEKWDGEWFIAVTLAGPSPSAKDGIEER